MKIWKKDEEVRVPCPQCGRKTDAVFQRRDVPVSAPKVVAENVLVAVCRECDGIAMIPRQSTPKLREAVQKPKETLNVRVPGHLEDVLYLLIDRVAHGWETGKSPVLKYLLHEFGNNPEFAHRVKKHLEDDLAQGPADQDVSVRVPSYVLVAVDQMAEMVGIKNRSEVVRGILVSAKEDVLEDHDPELAGAMERAMAVA